MESELNTAIKPLLTICDLWCLGIQGKIEHLEVGDMSECLVVAGASVDGTKVLDTWLFEKVDGAVQWRGGGDIGQFEVEGSLLDLVNCY